MIKKYFIIGLSALFVWAIILCAPALCENNEAKVIEKGTETTAQIVNNYSCPICDEEIDPNTAIMVEYNGKIYSLCCPACVKHFKKFPEKFSKKLLAH